MLITNPSVQKVGGKFPWRLTSALIWERADKTLIVVPAGFLTDFASVPRLPLIYAWVGGRGSMAAIIHDYLYTVAGTDAYPHITRKDADQEFLRAMSILKEPSSPIKRAAMYRAVRLFGGFSYQSRKPEEIFG